MARCVNAGNLSLEQAVSRHRLAVRWRTIRSFRPASLFILFSSRSRTKRARNAVDIGITPLLVSVFVPGTVSLFFSRLTCFQQMGARAPLSFPRFSGQGRRSGQNERKYMPRTHKPYDHAFRQQAVELLLTSSKMERRSGPIRTDHDHEAEDLDWRVA